jgi:hypothetical protein
LVAELNPRANSRSVVNERNHIRSDRPDFREHSSAHAEIDVNEIFLVVALELSCHVKPIPQSCVVGLVALYVIEYAYRSKISTRAVAIRATFHVFIKYFLRLCGN